MIKLNKVKNCTIMRNYYFKILQFLIIIYCFTCICINRLFYNFHRLFVIFLKIQFRDLSL